MRSMIRVNFKNIRKRKGKNCVEFQRVQFKSTSVIRTSFSTEIFHTRANAKRIEIATQFLPGSSFSWSLFQCFPCRKWWVGTWQLRRLRLVERLKTCILVNSKSICNAAYLRNLWYCICHG